MKLRNTNIDKLSQSVYDVLIVGGGINGAVSAAALAGKGVKTALIDKGDFAGMTSQESSNLAWGGIKYLESLEFALVRNLCKSRNHLIKNYPSRVKEIRFFTTIAKGFRFPPFFIWLGTWLYWLMGSCFTRAPRYLTRKRIQADESAIRTENASGGFVYSDAYFHDNDARFVFGFIRSALTYGCIAANYVEFVSAKRGKDGIWETTAVDRQSGKELTLRSRSLINAAGPLADQLNSTLGQETKHHLVLSKGIHLMVEKVTPNHRILTFFASDGRLFFVIPMGARTCIGTTDTPVDAPTKEVTEEDRQFVLDNINSLLKLPKPITKNDIIAERSGVRPLVVTGEGDGDKDWMQLSRKHAVEVSKDDNYLTIFGGKLTDCLNVGDEVCEVIKSFGIDIPVPDYKWYGEPDANAKAEFKHRANLINLDGYTSPDSFEKLSSRLWRRYGAAAFEMLERIQENPEEAEVLIKGTEYIRVELKETAQREMVTELEDFLRRRSKIALIERREVIEASEGLREACEILFGELAEEKLNTYLKAGSGS